MRSDVHIEILGDSSTHISRRKPCRIPEYRGSGASLDECDEYDGPNDPFPQMRGNTTDRERLDEMYDRVDDFSIPAMSGKLSGRANSRILW